MSEEEFFEFLEGRRGILDGVAVTGGEPTLQKGLSDFLRRIKEMGFKVKLDTNGYAPRILEQLLCDGLADHVAMDVKSSPDTYAKVSGVKNLDISKIQSSIDLLKSSAVTYEFRTTAVKGLHTASDFLKIGKWLGDVPLYFIQQFVNSGDIIKEGFDAFSKAEMTALLAMARVGTPQAQLRGVKD